MRFAFIATHRHTWPVRWLHDVLDVSRLGFHVWLNRPTSARKVHQAKLVTAIEIGFRTSHRTHVACCIWRNVLEKELACVIHQIERLIRINALQASPRRCEKLKDHDKRPVIAVNTPDRDFQADRPDQKKLAD